MSVISNATTYLLGAFDRSSAIREDLLDMIANKDPYDTPLMAALSRTTAKSPYHEWLTDTLAAADTTGLVEGVDYSASTASAPSRVVNWTQIFGKDLGVTNTMRAVDPAGFDDLYQYEVEKATKETMRNIEKKILEGSGSSSTGNATAAREMKVLDDFISTNVYNSTDYYNGGTTVGTTANAGFPALNDVNAFLDQIWSGSSGSIDLVVLGGVYKRQFSAFTTSNTRNILADAKKVTLPIDVIETEFGVIPLMLDRWSPVAANTVTAGAATTTAAGATDISGRVFFLEKAQCRLAYLRPFHHFLMGTRGDSVAGMVRAELTLEVGNEKALGVFRGVNNISDNT